MDLWTRVLDRCKWKKERRERGRGSGRAGELVERWKKVKVCKIRFALSSPTLGKLFRIEETFCLEIYINRCIYIYFVYGSLECVVRWNKSSKVSLWECSRSIESLRRGRHGLVMTLPSKSRSFRELQMVTRCSRFWNKQRTILVGGGW